MFSNRLRYAPWLALLLAACGDDTELPPDQILVAEAADATECPTGSGTRLVRGPDENGDGVLTGDERAEVQIVCAGTAGDPGLDGAQTLIRQSDAGEGCPNGGERIDAGLDDDLDGVLSDTEIDATTFICQGEDGQDGTPLLTVTSTNAEDICGDRSGTRIDTGFDDDRNGVLDEGEIDDTQAVCNGEGGLRSLIEIDGEGPGDNCPAGGRRVRTGLDENDDGLLAETEVVSTSFICNAAISIVEITVLASGDEDCFLGGQRIDTGLDLNGDGALEAAEVISTSVACNGSSGLPVLTFQQPIPSGQDCAEGGTRLTIGLDANLNGLLEAGEETSVEFICNGDPGTNGANGGVVRLSNEPSGINCPDGGTRIETGIDANANGVLDDSEVTNTSFACQGAASPSLVDILPEPPGANCADGGQRLLSGQDVNGNGQLDPSEITTTTFVCSTLANVPIRIEAATLSDGLLDNPYSAAISAVGGVGGDYGWSVTSGALPPGVTLAPSGTPTTNLSGSPTGSGTFTFTVEVEDFFGNTDTETFSIFVTAPFDITSLTLPRVENGVAYNATLAVNGGTAPFSWSVLEGTLPAGLSLSSAGVVSGTPTTNFGSYVVFEVGGGDGRTRRVGIDIKGTQRFIAYCGDVDVDTVEDLVIASIDAAGTVTATASATLPNTEADCAEAITFAPNRDAVAFIGQDTSATATDNLYVADISQFPSISTVQVNDFSGSPNTDPDVDVFQWSPTGDFIGYEADLNVNSREELVVADVRNLNAVTRVVVNGAIPGTSSSLEVSAFGWVPGSNKVVYRSDELVSAEENLYFYNADTQATRVQVNSPLPTSADVNLFFTFSPNGEWLAYTSDENVNDDAEAFLVDVSGPTPGATQSISGSIAAGGDVLTGTDDIAFSPNGDFLAFIADAANLGQEVFIRNVRNLAEPRVRVSPELSSTLFSTDDIRWSPDSRRIAARGDYFVSAETELYILDTEIPGSALTISGTPASNDVEFLGDTFAWSPNGDYVVYEHDAVTSAQDEPYLTFLDDFTNPVRLFSAGLDDDVQRVKISDDGTKLFMAVDFAGDFVLELFVTEISMGTVAAPVAVNSPSPLGTTQDIDEDFFLVKGGDRVFYITDEDAAAVEEAFLRDIGAGPVVGASTTPYTALPTGGDVLDIQVQEE
ncbi:MAG: putative Ig domain-containing protein [Myxococcota bacterium]